VRYQPYNINNNIINHAIRIR